MTITCISKHFTQNVRKLKSKLYQEDNTIESIDFIPEWKVDLTLEKIYFTVIIGDGEKKRSYQVNKTRFYIYSC